MKSGFYVSSIKHLRLIPKRYVFKNRFFWTRLNLDELDDLDRRTLFFSRNAFNLLSFYDRDHINMGHDSTRMNIEAYLRGEGIDSEVKSVELITNPRILGYTFNPVSFYFIETVSRPYLLIEVSNTFKEKKPYLVHPEFLRNGEWSFRTKKNFYVSPFTAVDNDLTIRLRKTPESITIIIDDFTKEGDLEMKAILTGKGTPWTTSNLIKLLLRYPLMTFGIITSIHYHALKLYLLGVPFWKKAQKKHLQTELFEYREKSYRKKAS